MTEYTLNENWKSKDYVKSPFRYPGGKFYALKHLIPFLSCIPHDEYREPFVGGGSVFFGKKKAKHNWINDLDTDIIDIYHAISDKILAKELILGIKDEVATRERHQEFKDIIPNSYMSNIIRTYYLNRTSYSGIINKPAWGYLDGKSSPPQNWDKFIISASHKLQDVRITSYDFEEIIKAPPTGESVLIYLDPPYYLADQKRAYTKSFVKKDHERLCELLKTVNYNFCLSYDDCDEVRQLYNWANIYERKWNYNTANQKGKKRIVGDELVITNYKVKIESLLL